MDINNEQIFLAKGGDIPVSRIVKFFEFQDNVAKEFLLESANLSYEEQLTAGKSEKKVKKVIAVRTAPKGETLQGFLRVISGEGWSYGTLGDWYRYYTKFSFSEGEGVYVPGTIYTDEHFNGWIPFVLPLKKDSFLQKVAKGGRKGTVVAKIFMKPAGSLIAFHTERQILISRVVKEPKGPSLL